MKRIIPSSEIVSKMKCPICGAELGICKDGNISFVCSGGRKHCYDLSSSGYLNMMPSGHTDSGDSKDAVRARKLFLELGHYRPVAESLFDMIRGSVPEKSFVIDAGCGEGYYSVAIAESGFYVAGADISKHAAEAAAKRGAARGLDNAFFTVGSVFALPFADKSADCVVNIFAPCAEDEFSRVLKDGGRLFVVYAGSEHLMGLKSAIYEKTKENDGRADMPKNMRLIGEKRVRYDITVSGNENILALFSMTPYYWRTSPADRDKLCGIDTLTTEVDMVIAEYIKE